ncbi:alpha/beta hydrolase [Alcaligenaceae bacterium]|nr:alpha/beta hydrolase [Alcaligenaceae bacterium]
MTDLYRNQDFIPDFYEIIAETAARSRELSTHVEARSNVPYGSSPREQIDIIFPPRLVKGAPLHVFIHGGYWRSGSKADHWLVAAPVLAAGGIAAFVGYDLMPNTRLGTIVGQIRAALAHLTQMAPELGADPGRYTVSGHSAGAHLASYLAATGPEENEQTDLPALRGLLLISGIYDLSEIPDSFLKNEAKMTHAEAAAWSPLSSRQLYAPRRIVMLAEHDSVPYHTQGHQFSSMLKANGMDTQLRIEAGLNHLTIVLALADPKSPAGLCLSELVAS